MIKEIKLIQDELYEITDFEIIKENCIESQKKQNKKNTQLR